MDMPALTDTATMTDITAVINTAVINITTVTRIATVVPSDIVVAETTHQIVRYAQNQQHPSDAQPRKEEGQIDIRQS